jgi:hypothetical protein
MLMNSLRHLLEHYSLQWSEYLEWYSACVSCKYQYVLYVLECVCFKCVRACMRVYACVCVCVCVCIWHAGLMSFHSAVALCVWTSSYFKTDSSPNS